MTNVRALDGLDPSTYYRLGMGLAVATVLLLVFGVGALGILGEGGRPDRIYVAVLAVIAVGALVARLRAHRMAFVLAAAAATQVLVTAIALAIGLPPDGAPVVDILGINAMYSALFAVAAWLFHRAAGAAQD